MRAQKNKILSKNKTKIVEPDNTQDKMPDGVNPEPKANFEPEVGSELEVSSSLGEASPSLDNITPNQDMGIDLEPESWLENEKDYSSDQDEMPEGINHSKKY